MGLDILLIEDNEQNLDLMSYLFNAFGHAVTAVRDGDQGIAAARSGSFDVIVCDIQLPKASGYDVARALRADPKTESAPLVAVTALAMVGDKEKVLAAGFDGFITKPIDPQTFVTEIENFARPGSCGATARQEKIR